jgi:5-methylcytosine-specific restriction protein A
VEGRVATAVHRRRERNPQVRRMLLASRRKMGTLSCDICAAVAPTIDHDLADAIFEAHHIVPLAQGEAKTKLSDLALLCASCHRLIHRAMSVRKRWLGVNEFASVLISKL